MLVSSRIISLVRLEKLSWYVCYVGMYLSEWLVDESLSYKHFAMLRAISHASGTTIDCECSSGQFGLL